MIESLTPEQEAKMPEYVKKWIGIGTDTNTIDVEKAKSIGRYYYEKILKKPVPEITVHPSPLACWKAICDFYKQKFSFVWPYIDGHFSAGYFSYYDFLITELGVKIENEHWDWYASTVNIGPMFPLDDMCLISDRPEHVHMVDGRLHNAEGPAIRYRDGFSVYSLNGVMVDKYLVETPWDQLDCQIMLKQTNAEVRREFVRKAGIEKIVKDLGAECIDKQGDYELLLLNLGDNRRRPYLKMLNPSIGTYHIEGVHPDCKTVDDALDFRNGGKGVRPIQLT